MSPSRRRGRPAGHSKPAGKCSSIRGDQEQITASKMPEMHLEHLNLSNLKLSKVSNQEHEGLEAAGISMMLWVTWCCTTELHTKQDLARRTKEKLKQFTKSMPDEDGIEANEEKIDRMMSIGSHY